MRRLLVLLFAALCVSCTRQPAKKHTSSFEHLPDGQLKYVDDWWYIEKWRTMGFKMPHLADHFRSADYWTRFDNPPFHVQVGDLIFFVNPHSKGYGIVTGYNEWLQEWEVESPSLKGLDDSIDPERVYRLIRPRLQAGKKELSP